MTIHVSREVLIRIALFAGGFVLGGAVVYVWISVALSNAWGRAFGWR